MDPQTQDLRVILCDEMLMSLIVLILQMIVLCVIVKICSECSVISLFTSLLQICSDEKCMIAQVSLQKHGWGAASSDCYSMVLKLSL